MAGRAIIRVEGRQKITQPDFSEGGVLVEEKQR